eukprot:gene15499-17078_t
MEIDVGYEADDERDDDDRRGHVHMYKLCGIPLMKNITRKSHALVIARKYYGKTLLPGSYVHKIWRFHHENYYLIREQFLTIFCESGMSDETSLAMNLCSDIVARVVGEIVASSSASRHCEQMTSICSSVCSQITINVMSALTENRNEVTVSNIMPQLHMDSPNSKEKEQDKITGNTDSTNGTKMRNDINTDDRVSGEENELSLKEWLVITEMEPAWQDIPIIAGKDGSRRFGGEWAQFFNSVVAEFNPHCVFAFKNNRVKCLHSRKNNVAFFTAYGVCTVSPCECTVTLRIHNVCQNKLEIEFKGLLKHDPTILKSRRITGEERQAIKDNFLEQRKAPANVCREKLSKLNTAAYAAGNRSGCGVSAKAFQNISFEVNAQKNDINHIAEKIPLSVVLFDEGSVHRYREAACKDVLFVDATGTIIEKIRGFKRILFYSLTTRNPLGKTPAIPISELISSTHTAGGISRLFSVLRDKEKFLYGDNIVPLAIMSDFSTAILSAVIRIFNSGMTTQEYTDKCYNIFTGVAGEEQKLTLALICSAHLMKANSRQMEACLKKSHVTDGAGSVKHIAMRIVRLLVNADCLADIAVIVELVYIVFLSEKVAPQLEGALQRLASIINKFQVDKKDDVDAVADDAENPTARLKLSNSKFNEYFDSLLKTTLTQKIDVACQLEKKTRKTRNIRKMQGKTILDTNVNNATAEQYFNFVKQGMRQRVLPTDEFIYRHFQDVQGLKRQFVDKFGKQKSTPKGGNMAKISRCIPRYPNDVDIACASDVDIPAEDEETWNKNTPKKTIPRKQKFGIKSHLVCLSSSIPENPNQALKR